MYQNPAESSRVWVYFSERWLLLTILLDFLFKKKSKLTLSVLFGLSTLLGIKPINVVSGWVWFSHDFLQNSNGRYFWRITPVAHVIESRSRDSPKFRIYSSKFQLINAKIDFFVLILGSLILGGILATLYFWNYWFDEFIGKQATWIYTKAISKDN